MRRTLTIVSSPTQALEGLQDEGGLAVGVEAVGAAVAVGPGLRRHHVGLAALAQADEALAAAGDPRLRARRPARPLAARGRVAAEVATAPALGPERVVGGLRRHVGVEALVEPGLLELVVRDEAVPELVAGLVDRHALRALQLRRGEDGGAAGEEGRVLHAPRGRAVGRVDHRDLGVGVGRRPRAVGAERDLRGLEVALGEVRVLGLHEEADVHRRVAGVVEARVPLEEAPARRPREVVDVLLHEAEGLGARRGCRSSISSRPVAPTTKPLRQRELHVVDAEVGEELGPGVERVAVPRALPEDADLREPLHDEVVVVHPAGPADAAVGHERVPLDPEAAGLAGRDRLRRPHLHHRPVVRVPVLGQVAHRGGQVGCPRPSPSSRTLFTWIQPKVRSSRFRSPGARRPSPRAVVERLLRKAFQ